MKSLSPQLRPRQLRTGSIDLLLRGLMAQWKKIMFGVNSVVLHVLFFLSLPALSLFPLYHSGAVLFPTSGYIRLEVYTFSTSLNS